MENPRCDYSAIISRKPLRWPNNARVAVWVIPNIEWFEFDWSLSGVLPDVRNFSRRDYGARVGIWRLMAILDKHNLRATVALNSAVCQHYPLIIEEAKKRRWEFMGHGITNSRPLAGLSEVEERRVVHECLATIEQATGERPRGWLGPGLIETYNTLDLLAEEGIRYVCDWVNDDQPYPMKVRQGSIVSLPYSIELNDMPLFNVPNFMPRDFLEMIRDQFDVLYREGAENGRVMGIALHPFLIGAPFRIKYLDEALAYIAGHDGVWFATGSEIEDWYCERYLGGL